MSSTNTKKQWLDNYQRLSEQAEALHDSQSISFGLVYAYDNLSECEKRCVHDILAEWLISQDNKLRYDAGFLASERGIAELKPAVEKALAQAVLCSDPESILEAKKLRRILSELSCRCNTAGNEKVD